MLPNNAIAIWLLITASAMILLRQIEREGRTGAFHHKLESRRRLHSHSSDGPCAGSAQDPFIQAEAKAVRVINFLDHRAHHAQGFLLIGGSSCQT